MSGRWSSRGASTVPVVKSSAKNPEQQPAMLDRSFPAPPSSLSPASASPQRSPVPSSLHRSGRLSLQQRSSEPSGGGDGERSPGSSVKLAKGGNRSPQSPGAWRSPGQSPGGPARGFPFPPSLQGGGPAAGRHPRVQVVGPYRYPEEEQEEDDEALFSTTSSLPRSMASKAASLPRSVGAFPVESDCVVEYPHQQMYLGASLRDSPEEHRERQLQRFAAMQNSSHHQQPEELYSDVPEPVPDYHDEDSNEFPPPPPPIVPDNPPAPLPPSPGADATSDSPAIIGVRNGAVSSPEDEGELIQPRKLVNPCLASRERQALHKELLLNYKLGKDVLQKPELNKILAKRKETQKRKEWEEMKANQRTSLELRLEEQANKLKEKEESDKMKTIEEDGTAPEFMQMHRRITSKTPTSPPT